jgi:hypothetical protein
MAIVTGTAANDVLAGTSNDDQLNGLTGADKMAGGDGIRESHRADARGWPNQFGHDGE